MTRATGPAANGTTSRGRRALLAGLVTLPIWPRLSRAQEAGEAAPAPSGFTQVVLLRHFEKEQDAGDDPGLTTAGQERARRLARLFARARVTHLYCSEKRRTRESLAALALDQGGTVEEIPARAIEPLAERLRGLCDGEANALAIVAGHSNTIPRIAAALGVALEGLDPRGDLPEAEYGRAVVVTLAARAADDTGAPRAGAATWFELSV